MQVRVFEDEHRQHVVAIEGPIGGRYNGQRGEMYFEHAEAVMMARMILAALAPSERVKP